VLSVPLRAHQILTPLTLSDRFALLLTVRAFF
jgi:hypothetical protein